MAEEISKQTDGDLFEIKTDKEYSDLTNEVKEEVANKERHNLLQKVDNIDEYDVVFVGYPVWWQSTPVINTFLENNDFSGKPVIPFCTHGGSGLSGTPQTIKNKLSGANVITNGFDIYRTDMESASDEVDNWLKELGIN